MLGSAWMALASGNVGYRIDAQNFFNRIQANPTAYQTIFYNWDNQYYAACLVMWQVTGQSVYQQQVRRKLPPTAAAVHVSAECALMLGSASIMCCMHNAPKRSSKETLPRQESNIWPFTPAAHPMDVLAHVASA